MPGPLHPLPPGSQGSCSQAQKRARASGCPGGPPSLVQPLSQGTHLGVNLPSVPAAPAAGRRPLTPGPSPAPREPPWVQPPGARALRLRTFPGPGEATASVAPGRHPSDSRHCWALSLRAAPGPEPPAAPRAERLGAGPRHGAGPEGSLRLAGGVRQLCAPWRGDSRCPYATSSAGGRAGTGRGGAGSGLPAGTGWGLAASCPCAAGAG